MNFKKKNIIARVTVAATLFTAIGALPFSQAVDAFAADEVTQLTSANPVADETSARSISIWKYQITDASGLGERGDGTYDASVNKDVIPGIKFKVQRVVPVAGGASLTDPKEQKLGDDYTIDGSFTEEIITTDASGKATIALGVGTAVDGIYLVTEQADDRTDLTATAGKKVETPAAPFFVYVPQTSRTDLSSLIYDVQVQPKNILESLVNPDKTIEGDKGFSIKAGQEFQWELAAKIPAGLWQVASQTGKIDIFDAAGNVSGTYDMVAGQPILVKGDDGVLTQPNFSMTDTLDKDLIYKEGSAKLQVKKADGEWIDLDNTNPDEPEYVVTVEDGTVKASLTVKGLETVGSTVNGYTDIRMVLTTTAKSDIWNGILDNNFTINYQIPGQAPKTVTPPEESKPKYFTGGFDILKTGEDTKAELSGAEFKIALNEDDAKAEKFIASDGKAYAKTDVLPEGVEYLLATSNESGRASFDGLALDWIDAGDKDGLVQDTEVSRSYWVVETKAPEGYELLKEPKEVVVNLATENNDDVELNVIDKPKTELPFTGGQGTTLLVAIALGAITIGTVAISLDKKRRHV